MSKKLKVFFSASLITVEKTTAKSAMVITEDPENPGKMCIYLEGVRVNGYTFVVGTGNRTRGEFTVDHTLRKFHARDGHWFDVHGKIYAPRANDEGLFLGPLTTVTHDPKTDTIS